MDSRETERPLSRIAFQGAPGAYSDMACRTVHPELQSLPCQDFEETFAAVRDGRADLAMIPIENSTAGRVADIHHLMPGSGLHIIAEHFQPVRHCLMALPGTKIEDLKVVRSHVQGLSQCRNIIRELGLKPIIHADTAGAAAEAHEHGDRTQAVIASTLAAETYNLEILREDIADLPDNTTRFLIMAREPIHPEVDSGPVVTSFVFRVRSVPAALYKALGGFATNGVNMTKLESYIEPVNFNVAQFYADVEGHPDQTSVRLALEELSFFSREVRILGVYPAHPFRWRGTGAL